MQPLVSFQADHPAFFGDDGSLVVLGSTGSIGQSTLKIVRQYRERFTVKVLAAHSNWQLLLEQIKEFEPNEAFLSDAKAFEQLKANYSGSTQLHFGLESIVQRCALKEKERVIAAMVGMVGLRPLLAALSADKCIALANKESIIVGAKLVAKALQQYGGAIIPVDSEHSALYQLLLREDRSQVKSLVLTASGGPFLDLDEKLFSQITPEQAVKHPRWNMGAKISIDSASMVNKALELAEAHWLFGFAPADIEVVVHPESIVHGILRLTDGSEIAHLSVPDMRAAIAYALCYPKGRLVGLLDQHKPRALDFRELDQHKFKAVSLMRQALAEQKGGVYNIANELAVAAFLSRGLLFSQIVPTIEETLNRTGQTDLTELDSVDAVWQEVSRTTQAVIERMRGIS